MGLGKVISKWVRVPDKSNIAGTKVSGRDDGQQGARRRDCHMGHCPIGSGEGVVTSGAVWS